MSASRRRSASGRRGAGPWRGVMAAAGALVLSVVVMTSVVVAALSRGLRADTITPGVHVAGIDVSGLTAPQAQEALRPQQAQVGAQPVELTCGTGQWTVSRSDLGVALDLDATVRAALEIGHTGSPLTAWRERRMAAQRGVDLPFSVGVDEGVLRTSLQRLADKVVAAPKPAKVVFDRATHGIHIEKDTRGRVLDLEATRQALTAAVGDLGRASVEIVVKESAASPTYEDLRHIDCVLGSYNTKYVQGETNRAGNIALAASKIDGVFLAPGERFSYNETVGERTEAAGFKKAHVYEEGEVRDGIGGGICQVSTTLYNAALIAGLKISERRPHMMPVAYVPTGRDATVDYNTRIDLAFVNSTPHTIVLRTFAGGGSLTCLFLGAKGDKPEKVEIVRSGESVTEFETQKVPDSTVAAGETVVKTKGRRGFRVTVHRVIKMPGQPEKKELLSVDSYAKRNEVVLVGPELPKEPGEGASEGSAPPRPSTGNGAKPPGTAKPGGADRPSGGRLPDGPVGVPEEGSA